MHEAKLLNKLSVSQLAELSKLSKSYISQVKSSKRPPSQKLLDALGQQIRPQRPEKEYLYLFLQSRQAMGVTPRTLGFYKERLWKFVAAVDYPKASRKDIELYLNSIPANRYGLATRHASFRAIKTFYRWLNAEYGMPNPIKRMPAPILGKPILPSLTQEQVLTLLETAESTRDKAIIALLTESGLRLSELAGIKPPDINWSNHTLRVMGKGRREADAPFGKLSEKHLTAWLKQYQPNGSI